MTLLSSDLCCLLQTLGRGVFRGIGWQLAGSVLSFVCFYLVAWPIALPLTFLTPLNIVGQFVFYMHNPISSVNSCFTCTIPFSHVVRKELKFQMALRHKSGLFPVQWQCRFRTFNQYVFLACFCGGGVMFF